jgi:pimeloyl-ACP methyl ester carboxylesterase
MDALDYIMMKSSGPLDDENLAYQRLIGDTASNIICFLPWRTSIATARRIGFAPHKFMACYQLPPAIVSSEPELCAEAVERLVADSLVLLSQFKKKSDRMVVVGLSLGSAPATVLANLTGARLISVTSADRGDLMLWESPAASAVKLKAERKGYRLADFSRALEGYHPVQNLRQVRGDSVFVVSDRDMFVPAARRAALLNAVKPNVSNARVLRSARGHVRTILSAISELPKLISAT